MNDRTADNTRRRAEELLQRFFDRELTPPEGEELFALWDASPELEHSAVENFKAECPLAFLAALENRPISLRLDSGETLRLENHTFDRTPPEEPTFLSSDSPALQSLLADLLPAEAEPPPESGRTPAFSSFFQKTPTRVPWLALSVMLAFFVFAIWSEFSLSPVREDPFIPSARIVRSVDAVWNGEESFKSGRLLGNEKLSLRSGVVQIRTKKGVDLILEGPAELLIRDPDEMFCQTGRISAEVPPEGKGFQVNTPFASVVDQGTKFSLQIDEEKVDVHVIQGVVDVARSKSNKIILTEGLAAMLDLKGDVRQFQSNPDSFFSSEKLRGLWTLYAQRRQTVWDAEDQRHLSDPNLLVRLDRERARGGRWVDGCLPHRQAFRLQSKSNGVDVSMPGEHSALTIVAVVRLADMKNFTNTLCLGADFASTEGAFFWQLANDGILSFYVQNNGVRRFDTGREVRRSDWNTWLHLAVVADGPKREIRQYVDGRRVASSAWNNPVPLRMPEGTIGNAPSDQRKLSPRYWNGDIDTFYIFSKALGDDEIARTYENMN